MSENSERKVLFDVNVHLEIPQGEKLPGAMVFAYDDKGNFLASGALPRREKSKVVLELPARLAGQKIQVLVGPAMPVVEEKLPLWMESLLEKEYKPLQMPTPDLLDRRNAVIKSVLLPRDRALIDLKVPFKDWQKWLYCPCIVRGRLIKKVLMPDGTSRDWGICHACILIYEVDSYPKFIMKLPARELRRLRDDILKHFKEPLPRPPKIIPIPPEPPPVFLKELEMFKETGSPVIEKPAALVSTPVIPLPPPEEIMELMSGKFITRKDLEVRLEPIFKTDDVKILRNEMIARAEFILPFLCGSHWLFHWYTKDLIKCVCTDEEGYFETTIWYPCSGDKPDLYFKALQCIGGSLHVLFDPGVACHTHWNYACGSEVTLVTTDPAAITCVPADPVSPPPGVTRWIMPYGIGGIPLNQIKPYWEKDVMDVWHIVDPDPALRGLTSLTDGSGTWMNIPFGSTLGFRHGYSGVFPLNVPGQPYYYRWEYNQLDDDGNETGWHDFAVPVAQSVVRHYVDEDLAHPEKPPTFPAYTLGPKEKNGMHLYEIKPHNPPQPAGHHCEWPADNWFGEIYTGILTSTNLPGSLINAAGKYRFRLTVYDLNGNLVPPSAGTFRFIVPTGLDTDDITVLAREADASEIEGNGYIFTLHIDNNVCEASIFDAKVADVPAGICGFIAYSPGDDVHLSFKADQANGFARFKFTLAKGSSGKVEVGCAPSPSGVAWANAPLVTDSPVNGFSRDGAHIYHKDVNETLIRGGCLKAAFAETLYVAATATNGWVRLSGLDASATPKAFALEPKSP